MADHLYIVRDINPEPWKSPEQGGRKGGKPIFFKPERLRNYQDGLAEEFRKVWNGQTLEGEFKLHFFFWRELVGNDQGADATNLQKAAEDALQKILYDNDRSVRHVSSTIMEQAHGIRPRIIIRARHWGPADLSEGLELEAELLGRAAQEPGGNSVRANIRDVRPETIF